MTADLRRRGRPAWLFRQLSQGRFIFRIFLMGLLLLFFLGFAGALQRELSAIGAGQTELAYTVASLRNAASLTPIKDEGRYTLTTTADAALQRYFTLDQHRGVVVLRDGLKSLSFLTNPLGSFPLQIVESETAAEEVKGRSATKVISLYIHILNCDGFLSKLSATKGTAAPEKPDLSEADRVLHCMQSPPVIQRAATLKEVNQWITANTRGLLVTQQQAYLKEADEILSLPRLLPGGPPPPYAWGEGSAPIPRGESPVWNIFVLQDMAKPGLEIFRPGERTLATTTPAHPPPASRQAAPESAAGAWLRTLDRLFLVVLQLRYPVLISLGILLPLLALIVRQRDVVVRRCLEPYLLLLLAQVVTLLVAEALMGEGLMIWVGFVYTLLRLLQLVGLLWMSGAADQRLRRLFDLGPRPWLRNLLRLELVLWSINALGLGWHIVGVFRDFPFISPA
jgi:hypothetical protein